MSQKKHQSLYQSNQQKIIDYVKQHHLDISRHFDQLSNSDSQSTPKIKVERVFDYLKSAFSLDGFEFQVLSTGSAFFVENNRDKMELLLQRFYDQIKGVPKEKFMFYRTSITEEEVADLIEFWVKNYDDVYVNYDQVKHELNSKKPSVEFEAQKLLDQIQRYELMMAQVSTEAQKARIQQKISDLKKQLEDLFNEQQIRNSPRDNSNSNPQENKTSQIKVEHEGQLQRGATIDSHASQNKKSFQQANISLSELPAEVSKMTQMTPDMRKQWLKLIFEYYTKQNYSLSGSNATFQRIQQQATSLSYSKVVHFMKDFSIKYNDKQQPFRLFQKVASNLKSLDAGQFQQFLKTLARSTEDESLTDTEKQDRFFNRMFASDAGKPFKTKIKARGMAFDSRQKNDFRIKPDEIKYAFKLSPHSGKLSSQIMEQLQRRKEDKQQHKIDVQKVKEQANQKFLKKLSSIDPFNSSLVALKESAPKQEQGVVALNNLEAFRDSSFNPQEYFRLSDDAEDDPFLSAEYALHSPKKHTSRQRPDQRDRSKELTRPQVPTPSKKTTHQNQTSDSYSSPRTSRRARTKSIAEEISARAQEVGRLQVARQESLIQHLAAHSNKRTEQGLDVVRKSGKYEKSPLNSSMISSSNNSIVVQNKKKLT